MYQKLARLLGMAAVLAVAACAETEEMATGTAEDEAAIRAIATAYASAYSARDAAALAAMVTEDYETVAPNGMHMSGRAAMEQQVAAEMATMPTDMAVTLSATTDFLRWINATHAVAGGTWSVAGAPPEAGPNRGSWLGVMRKDADGTWRMMSGASAPDMPAPAPAPADSTGME